MGFESINENGWHLTDDIFKCILLNKNFLFSYQAFLRYVPEGLVEDNSALVQGVACRWTGDKPLPELMVTKLND